MRLSYPTTIKIIRVPCTGKVDTLHIMRAFEKGADGVYVVGCREGDCHYNSGNFRAKKRVEQAKELLDAIGIGGNRVRMCNLSSSDGPLFVKYAEEMHERICAAGPNPIKLVARKRSTTEAGSTLAAPS
jgi:coenzyme F420-reducing hydrogenase delta subunit